MLHRFRRRHGSKRTRPQITRRPEIARKKEALTHLADTGRNRTAVRRLSRHRDIQKGGGPRGNIPRGPPLRRSAVHRSAAPCSPTGFPRSTIGAGRLSFRVRNGTGRAPAARTADRWAALRPGAPACPWGPHSEMRHRPPARGGGWEMRRARAISTPRLSASPRLHLGPINQVVYLGPYRKEN